VVSVYVSAEASWLSVVERYENSTVADCSGDASSTLTRGTSRRGLGEGSLVLLEDATAAES